MKSRALMISTPATIALLLPLGWTASRQSEAAPANPESDRLVDVFGERVGEPIGRGLLFVNGCYVECPYRVGWRGTSIYVNNVRYRRLSLRWPPMKMEVDEDPGIPVGLTPQSRLEDDSGPDSHWHRKLRYLYQHYPAPVAKEKMIEYFRALPFVKEVRRFDPEASSIYVENLSGGTIGVTLPSEAGAASIRKTMTRETVVEWLERECRGLESSLQADLCVFSYEKGLMTTLSSRKAGEVLPMVVQTLTSSKTEDEKFQALELYGLTDPQNRKVCEGLVKDFRPSQQLQDRIGGLRKKIPCVLPVPSPEEHDAMVRQALATPGTLEQKRAAFNKLLEAKRPVLRDAEPASRPTSQ